MRPSLKTLDFTSNENATNTYFYRKWGRLYVQLSWQTCRPHYHFVKRIRPMTSNFWNYYPLELSYDWFYDYHVGNVRLHLTKYHQNAPKCIKEWLKGHDPFVHIADPNNILNLIDRDNIIVFDEHSKPPYSHGRSLIGFRNYRIIKDLKAIAKFRVTLHPSPGLLKFDNMALEEIISYIHRKNEERQVFNAYRHNPFSIDTPSQDAIMQLVGFGYNALTVMRKIWKAQSQIEYT